MKARRLLTALVIALLISALAVSLVAIYLLWNGTIKPNQEIRAAPGPSPARPSSS